jgi:hypothetical protein
MGLGDGKERREGGEGRGGEPSMRRGVGDEWRAAVVSIETKTPEEGAGKRGKSVMSFFFFLFSSAPVLFVLLFSFCSDASFTSLFLFSSSFFDLPSCFLLCLAFLFSPALFFLFLLICCSSSFPSASFFYWSSLPFLFYLLHLLGLAVALPLLFFPVVV